MQRPTLRNVSYLLAILLGISVFSNEPLRGQKTESEAQDTIEFLNGTRLSGAVTAIRAADKEFDFSSKFAGRTVNRTYAFSDVHAVTIRGKRHVLTPKQAPNPGAMTRTRQEVRQWIEAAAEYPDWYSTTQSNPPPTLDLSWPDKPDGGWNNKKNVGQYIWDIINPNPNRWRAGIKLVHEILEGRGNEPALIRRDRSTLGRMYFELLQDYARAAYWIEKADVPQSDPIRIKLAECYWRLGNREMALEQLDQPRLQVSAIKLLGELGEVDRALRLAGAFEGSRVENDARILAADLLRSEGRLQEALDMYTKVIKSNSYRNDDYEKRFKGRAQDSIDAIQLFDQADVARVADGKYRSTSIGYNGDVEVEVSVAGGQLQKVEVVRHREKQFYAALEDTPRQLIEKQSVRDIDGFSGATITSNAIVNATAKALAKGTKP